MDDELREQYLALVRQGKGPVTCARAVGATARAMAAYIAADIRFAEQVDEARAEALELVANAAWERAQGGDWAVAKELLQAGDPDTWMPVKDQNLRLTVGSDDDIDIGELHKRLASQPMKELSRGEDEA